MDLSGIEEFGMAAPDLVDYQSTLGGRVWPQIACRPMVMQFTLQDPPTPLGNLVFWV